MCRLESSQLPTSEDSEEWECERGCGFKDCKFEVVEAHEANCQQAQTVRFEDVCTAQHAGEWCMDAGLFHQVSPSSLGTACRWSACR